MVAEKVTVAKKEIAVLNLSILKMDEEMKKPIDPSTTTLLDSVRTNMQG